MKGLTDFNMRDLSVVRDDINDTDKKIIELFEKRMDLSKEVADYKIKNSLPVFDAKREAQKLEGVKALVKNKNYCDWAVKLLNDMMLYSKEYQRKLSQSQTAHLTAATNEKIAFQGINGANSQQAAKSFFGSDANLCAESTFEDVFKAVNSEKCKYGVLPLENFSTGMVSEVFDLLLKYDLFIVGEYNLKIDHLLLGCEGASLEDIREVISHPQALYQCSNFLSKLENCKTTPCLNTALSAKTVSDKKDKTVAAIASIGAKTAYNLEIIKKDISNSSANTTRFIVVSKDKSSVFKPDKVSVVFGLSHTYGALSNYLSIFANSNINLLKLESRPVTDNLSKFNFFVDFEINGDTENTLKLLTTLEKQAGYFKLLGLYKSHK